MPSRSLLNAGALVCAVFLLSPQAALAGRVAYVEVSRSNFSGFVVSRNGKADAFAVRRFWTRRPVPIANGGHHFLSLRGAGQVEIMVNAKGGFAQLALPLREFPTGPGEAGLVGSMRTLRLSSIGRRTHVELVELIGARGAFAAQAERQRIILKAIGASDFLSADQKAEIGRIVPGLLDKFGVQPELSLDFRGGSLTASALPPEDPRAEGERRFVLEVGLTLTPQRHFHAHDGTTYLFIPETVVED